MIIVIGSINLDLIARVDALPAPGETVPGSDFTTAAGGKGANQALAAARAGGTVRMIGAVGKDAFAAQATAQLSAGGVDLSGVADTAAATGTAMILVGGDGENMIAVIPGANAAVLPGDVAKAKVAKGDFVLLQHEVGLETVAAALAQAKEAGACSVLNTAPFRAEAAAFLRLADFLVANETEFDRYAQLLDLAGDSREERMRAYAGGTGKCLIVTLGADGVAVAAGPEFFTFPAMKIEPVDTVGAGDTFCGYLAQGLEAGLPLKDAVARASVAGSLACLKQGAQPSIPMAADVEKAMKS